MGKGYYIVGAVLIGVGAFLLYNKVKSGNVNFNTRSQDDIVEAEDGSHLNPPLEVPTLETPPIV
jgi:hypothetical protein